VSKKKTRGENLDEREGEKKSPREEARHGGSTIVPGHQAVKWAAVTSSSAILEARPPANASTSAELRITWKERQSLFFFPTKGTPGLVSWLALASSIHPPLLFSLDPADSSSPAPLFPHNPGGARLPVSPPLSTRSFPLAPSPSAPPIPAVQVRASILSGLQSDQIHRSALPRLVLAFLGPVSFVFARKPHGFAHAFRYCSAIDPVD